MVSLNWKELQLILSELPLTGSLLQQVTQHSFHALTWEFYNRSAGRWYLYTEVGTPSSSLHRIATKAEAKQKGKTGKLQRFIQFSRAHLEGALVTDVWQQDQDRLIKITMNHHGEHLFVFFRFYSGAQANIIVTDENLMIKDLLFRRPARGEQSGEKLILHTPSASSSFTIRERVPHLSFNEQIALEHSAVELEETFQLRKSRLLTHFEKELAQKGHSLQALQKRLKIASEFESLKDSGDLLSSSLHLVQPKSSWVTVPGWELGETFTIALDPKLSPSENAQAYYTKYQKAKASVEHTRKAYELAEQEYAKLQKLYEKLKIMSEADAEELKRLYERTCASPQKTEQKTSLLGLQFTSGAFLILVGRTAKENDELLRHHVRGNDYWMHTRDVAGGYVFIKYIKGKSVPLDVLLDAAHLALHFSKARSAGKADLYYTQVKYLRRAKDAKVGLVIPTQEKNIHIELDAKRLSRLLSGEEVNNEASKR